MKHKEIKSRAQMLKALGFRTMKDFAARYGFTNATEAAQALETMYEYMASEKQ